MRIQKILTVALGCLILHSTSASSNGDSFGSGGNSFNIGFVPISGAGNAADSTGFGAVSYAYNMGVIDVTQAMINVATALGAQGLGGGAWNGNQPAANVTWYQAAAFVNWLNASQGFTVAYNLTYSGNTPVGLTPWTGADVWTLGGTDAFRNTNTHYFLPSEDEWYKAAFYDQNKGGTGVGGYWLYAEGSDSAPASVTSGTAHGTAVYDQSINQGPATVDQSGGLSPNGTQGQTGNVWQWMETDYYDSTNSNPSDFRAIQGGDWSDSYNNLQSGYVVSEYEGDATNFIGFRVASIPEPNSLLLVLAGFAGFAAMRHKYKS